ncbi:RagB/SusD family nutrient uptake outer membrane protein [Prevotella sp.]|uniref:RagB/SusD family nutrient uptake outer membrane protein n=1 Tax=uncultured Prevotella sp. TaxID=159272 RepID=UPI0025F1BEA9|nr:RagB/SusD family nutrient uptake outer membrane protein [Prevotella sp.]MCI7182719.1 RagB/SusD family nutrient uptake outer membrane protein [Prevotella sp.]
MKKSLLFALASSAMVLATSCTNLDVDVKSQYTDYPTESEVALEAKMADVYYAFRKQLGDNYNRIQSFSSDEVAGISFDGDYYDNAENVNPTLHNFKYDNKPLNYWADLASGITKCNQVIEDLGGDKAKPEQIAPARVMRAFYHFILMDSFGDVPILDCLPDDDEAVERMPRRQVAEFIESELKACLPSLTKNCNAATYGKPTYWMAEALLVKLYINWAVYTADNVADYDAATSRNAKLDECVRLCDDIMQNGPFDLSDNYRKKFLYNNGPQIKDFIYAMPYDKVNATGMLYGRYRTFRKVDNGDTMGYLGGKMNKSCAGIFALNEEYSNLFTLKGDDRNEIILGATTDGKVYIHDALTGEATIQPYMYKGSQLVLSKKINLKDDSETSRQQINCGANATGWSQGYRSLKFYPNPNEYSEYNRNQSNDVPIFRFADIILTKAEALLRGARATNADTPESLLNQIRTYVHAAKFVGNPSLQDILDERGREFVDENWRRNDMIRFGTFESEYGFHRKGFPGARFDKSCRILPVPKAIMDENQNWKQNEGYKK